MTWALIINGLVHELTSVDPVGRFNPAMVWVDCTATPGVAVGWSYNGTTFAAPPAPPAPTLQQQAAALLGSPVTVACTSVPALNGSYPIDQDTQMQITGVAAAINAGLGLPGGGATFNWPDASGAAHPWPATQFTAFAKAVMNFVYNAAQVAQGHGTTLPATTITIA